MLTSPRTNGVDNFVPSHHLALITQPVLGARSRSRRKTTNIILETSTTTKDKVDSMTNSRRSSYNDSPPLILPINRIDTSQYQKKTNSNSHHESSDSGLDLSVSTNSSVQLQQYPQQHIPIHRPLSALNEDSSPDDGYYDEHQQTPLNPVRLRFPPVNFGRNRSMEDIINNNTREQQHRSSSFSDERQQKLFVQQEQKIKRSSDGALLDVRETSPQSIEPYRRTNNIKNELIYPSITQQHRSLNDLTNKNSNRILPIRNESNMSTNINNLSSTQTITRKPNTSTLKPLRKKTKLNIIVEPSIPLTPSRLAVYDEQINTMTGTTSSSSNQTTPRSIRPVGQQQIKSKASTPLGYYSNQDQIRANINRSVIERQHPPTLPAPPPRRGLIQQLIPFDASPSKVNNLLLRHHVQQHQPTIIFHPNSNGQLSPSRQLKQTLPTLYNEEIISNVQEEKRKQIKYKEQEEKKHLKQKDDLENNKSNEIYQKGQGKIKIKDIQESIPSKTIHKRQNQYEHNDDNRQRRMIINERHGSGQSSSTISNINRQQQRNTKPTGLVLRNKPQNNNHNRTTETNNQYEPDYSHGSQKSTHIGSQIRPSKIHLQTFENSTNRNSSIRTQIDQNRQLNQSENSKYGPDHHRWQKSQPKPTRIQLINPNLYDSRRERETSRLSNISKTDSIQYDEKQLKQKFLDKNSSGNFQTMSPTSWSIISEHQNNQQQIDIYEKTNTLSISPSSHNEFIEENSPTPSRTYRLIINDQQPIDGRYVVPSNNNLQVSSISESSHHTYPFTFTPDFETNNDTLIENKNKKSLASNVYTLSDHDNRHSPSPLVHLSPNKKFSTSSSSPPLPSTTKVTISKEKDEIISNYDSDDGWSDDSAELLYVDERYATEERKNPPSSHLPSQQHYHYQLQQQNVLLQ